MIVVADSSPLVVTAAIGCVEVLSSLFKKIIIPPGVASELTAPNRSATVRDLVRSTPDWLEVLPPTSVEAIPSLHAGEIAAIALARELAADLLIIDERRGRRAAVERQVRIVGTIGLLEMAADRGFIDLPTVFNAIKQTNFWISPKFLDERLFLFRERKRRREKAR